MIGEIEKVSTEEYANFRSPILNGQFVIFTNENRRSKLKITVSIALGTLEMVDDNSKNI